MHVIISIMYVIAIAAILATLYWLARYSLTRQRGYQRLSVAAGAVALALCITNVLVAAHQETGRRPKTDEMVMQVVIPRLEMLMPILRAQSSQACILLLVAPDVHDSSCYDQVIALVADHLPPSTRLNVAVVDLPFDESVPEMAVVAAANSRFDQLVGTHDADLIIDTTCLLLSCQLDTSGTWQLAPSQRPQLVTSGYEDPCLIINAVQRGWIEAAVLDWDAAAVPTSAQLMQPTSKGGRRLLTADNLKSVLEDLGEFLQPDWNKTSPTCF